MSGFGMTYDLRRDPVALSGPWVLAGGGGGGGGGGKEWEVERGV